MKTKLIPLLLLFFTAASAEQALVQYLDLPESSQAQTMAADSSGNLFVISNVMEFSGRPQIRALKIDSHGATLASLDFGGSRGDTVAGAAVDSQGNLVIVGSTISADFPLVSPLISTATAQEAFVVKIDGQLKNILFSTLLGGTKGPMPLTGSSPGGVAVDQSGNIYVTGSTTDTDFPVTAGAFQTQPPQSDPFGSAVYAFLTEISSDGSKIVFSTYFGDSAVVCIGGSHCLGAFGYTVPAAIQLDVQANIVIAGRTTASQLPVTAGVYGPQCNCTKDSPGSFLAKFAPGGAHLVWATYLPPGPGAELFEPPMSISGMALNNLGDLIIAGSISVGLPLTANALQSSPPSGTMNGFVTILDPGAQHLLFSSYFGGGAGILMGGARVAGVVVDPQGVIWINGASAPDQLPAPPGTPQLGIAYVAELSPDGSTVASILTAPQGAVEQAIVNGNDRVIALGPSGSMVTITPAQGPSLVGLAGSAAATVSNAVVPYELISLYGIGLGPATPAGAQVVNGVVTSSLAGVQVLFDGVAAPLLYVGPTQINAVVPRDVMTRDTTTLQVLTPSGPIPGPTMLIRQSQPGVFASGVRDPNVFPPPAAVLNQDGTVNSSDNPAKAGSIVSIFATGGGAPYGVVPDGTVATGAGGGPGFPVSVLHDNLSVEVLYAGDAPGTVTGVLQINFRLPEQFAPSDFGFQLQIGDALSDSFSIYIRP
jgi:uncharacterized protein (TIGR03437 family)